MGQSYEIYCKKYQGHDLVFLNDLEMDIDYLRYPELIGFEDEE